MLALPEVTTSAATAVVPFESGRHTLFEPGVAYRQDALLVPFEVAFAEDGWRSDLSREQLVTFLNTDGTSVSAAIAIWVDGTAPDDLLASVAELATTVVGPKPRTVGGVDGELIDVQLGPLEIDPDNSRDHPCDNAWDFKADQEIGEISQFERKQFGTLAACGWSRVWLGSLDGPAVVLTPAELRHPGDPVAIAALDRALASADRGDLRRLRLRTDVAD